MTTPNPKLYLSTVLSSGGGYSLLPKTPGDFSLMSDAPAAPWLAPVADVNGDLAPEVLIGAPTDDDKDIDAGRIFVRYGNSPGGLDDLDTAVIIDGVNAGDQAGAAVGVIGDLNGDGLGEYLIGAPGVDDGANTDAGAGYVVWGTTAGGIDLGDLESAGGDGYIIRGEATGDSAGQIMASVADLNGDGKSEVLIGAAGNDAGGADAGAAYVVFGKSGTAPVNLSSVATGTGGYKITGENAGDAAGQSLVSVADQNGDGKADILVGAAGNDAGGAEAGAAYVVFGKSTGTAVNLDSVAAGTGGYKIIGQTGEAVGTAVANLGDVNGDGIGDVLVGGTSKAYVVYGKNDTTAVQLSNVEAGVGGFAIQAEDGTDFSRISVAGGGDLNGDGVNDILIGTPTNSEGGYNAGAVYAVWGGTGTTVDLAQIAAGIGGAKIVGDAGSLTGTAVAFAGDLNGDGRQDILIGSSGFGEQVATVYSPDEWKPDYTIYGTEGDDVMGPGYGGLKKIDDTDNVIQGLGGADSINAAGGNDQIDGGAGADSMTGGTGNDTYQIDDLGDAIIENAGEGDDTAEVAVDGYVVGDHVENIILTGSARSVTGSARANTIQGTADNDSLDGGAGADTLIGGAGDDTYVVDTSTDAITEVAGEGTDTVIASADYVLGAEVENLTLVGGAHRGTGNGLDNALLGGAGSDTLEGMGGNDSLDGGAGADIMVGGAGDDTYYVDDLGDVVNEALGEGSDTVVTSVDWVMNPGTSIEYVRLTGAAHSLTGNDDNNKLAGTSGDDRLDGGAGDDTLLGGDGNDDLISESGTDTLSGGSGDDRYVLKGGSAHIEDYLGHDSIDASEATGNSYLDLSGETESEVEGQICNFTPGGTTSSPLDVQFLQDLSGSFGDDIATVRTLVPSIVTALRTVQANSQFGSSSFVDKAVNPFGASGEWVYRTELALSNDIAALASTYNNMLIRFGNDAPEAQIESLMQLALHSTEVGFRPDSARFVVLFTDAPFHVAGDGAAGGITTPNNGDAVMDVGAGGAGTGEDYPMVAQVRAALQAANIIPIFAVAGGVEATYQTLVSDLGRGTVVTLTANSSNVVSAITSGLTAATTTHIEDAKGGAGDDTLLGSLDDNYLVGGAGADKLDGKGGHDKLEAGTGNDSVVYDSADTLEDGGSGSDTLVVKSGVVVDLRSATDQTSGDTAIVKGFESVDASASTVAVSLTGNDGFNALTGGSGDDIINGMGGGDVLKGGDGKDVIDGGAGADKIYAGNGNDKVVYDGADVRVEGNGGGDTLVVNGAATIDLSQALDQTSGDTAVVVGFEGVDATGSAVGVTITGSNSVNSIKGSVGADIINTLDGNDSISSGDGNDTVDGGLGADSIYTGAGNDRVVYDGADVINSGGLNYDTLVVNSGGSFNFSLSADQSQGDTAVVQGYENLDARGSATTVSFVGNTTNNNVFGGSADDSLAGGDGVDMLSGQNGNDLIDGGKGNDNLFGGAGNDRFITGLDNDTIGGGSGVDTFAFTAKGLGYTTVTDFSVTGLDVLDLSLLITTHPVAMDGYVRATDSAAGTLIAIDETGAGVYTDLGILNGVHGKTAQDLYDHGNIWLG